MSSLYVATLLIELICRVHYVTCQLVESQAVLKIAGRNINNLRYANNTTLMAESEEEPKSLLVKMKEESEKAGLKLNFMAPGPIIPWQIDGETVETVTDFFFFPLDSK